jgi:hypothetical protein
MEIRDKTSVLKQFFKYLSMKDKKDYLFWDFWTKFEDGKCNVTVLESEQVVGGRVIYRPDSVAVYEGETGEMWGTAGDIVHQAMKKFAGDDTTLKFDGEVFVGKNGPKSFKKQTKDKGIILGEKSKYKAAIENLKVTISDEDIRYGSYICNYLLKDVDPDKFKSVIESAGYYSMFYNLKVDKEGNVSFYVIDDETKIDSYSVEIGKIELLDKDKEGFETTYKTGITGIFSNLTGKFDLWIGHGTEETKQAQQPIMVHQVIEPKTTKLVMGPVFDLVYVICPYIPDEKEKKKVKKIAEKEDPFDDYLDNGSRDFKEDDYYDDNDEGEDDGNE